MHLNVRIYLTQLNAKTTLHMFYALIYIMHAMITVFAVNDVSRFTDPKLSFYHLEKCCSQNCKK